MNKTLQTIKSLLSPKKKSRLPIPTTDIHTHILPGVDDGFTRIEDSVEALRRLQSLGVKEVVLTPHMHADVYRHTNEKLVRERYAELLTQIPEDLTIKTSLAAEYMILDGFDDRAEDPELLTYEDNSILIEMSYMFKSPNLEHTVFNLAMSGKKPILAHPSATPISLTNSTPSTPSWTAAAPSR